MLKTINIVSCRRWGLYEHDPYITDLAEYDDDFIYTEYYTNGNIKTIRYYIDSKLHHDNDLPAIIEYYYTGLIKSAQWFLHGDKHREEAPAVIQYSKKSKILHTKWYLRNHSIEKEILELIQHGKHSYKFKIFINYNFSTYKETYVNYLYTCDKNFNDLFPEIYQKVLKSKAVNLFD